MNTPTLTKGSKVYFMYQDKPTEAQVLRVYPLSRPSPLYESKITTEGDMYGVNHTFRESEIGKSVFRSEEKLMKKMQVLPAF